MHLPRWTRAALATACFAVTVQAPAQTATAHDAAQTLIAQVAADAHAQVAVDALGQARTALERGTRIRATGDQTHAKAADELALEWAQTARDLVKAAEAETTAADVRKKAVDAQAQLERTRAAVEEGIARVGRLKAELAEAEARGKDNRTAVEKHDPEPGKKAPGPGKKGAAKRPGPGQPVGDAP